MTTLTETEPDPNKSMMAATERPSDPETIEPQPVAQTMASEALAGSAEKLSCFLERLGGYEPSFLAYQECGGQLTQETMRLIVDNYIDGIPVEEKLRIIGGTGIYSLVILPTVERGEMPRLGAAVRTITEHAKKLQGYLPADKPDIDTNFLLNDHMLLVDGEKTRRTFPPEAIIGKDRDQLQLLLVHHPDEYEETADDKDEALPPDVVIMWMLTIAQEVAIANRKKSTTPSSADACQFAIDLRESDQIQKKIENELMHTIYTHQINRFIPNLDMPVGDRAIAGVVIDHYGAVGVGGGEAHRRAKVAVASHRRCYTDADIAALS